MNEHNRRSYSTISLLRLSLSIVCIGLVFGVLRNFGPLGLAVATVLSVLIFVSFWLAVGDNRWNVVAAWFLGFGFGLYGWLAFDIFLPNYVVVSISIDEYENVLSISIGCLLVGMWLPSRNNLGVKRAVVLSVSLLILSWVMQFVCLFSIFFDR